MTKLTLEVAGKTDPGCVRENNEDSLAVDEGLGLLIVADGMGGHNSGEVASRLATENILDLARKMLCGPRPLPPPEGGNPALSARGRLLEFLVKTANGIIYQKAQDAPQYLGMGTTVVAVFAADATAVVGHVGDSRLYLLRNGRLQALTEDHSLVADQVRHGVLTAVEAEQSSLQNILTRALGTDAEVEVDVDEHPLLAGDVLLLCTDGLTKMVPDTEVERLLKENPAPAAACGALVELAKAKGGQDNVTAVVARAAAAEGPVKKFLRGVLKRA